MAKKKKNNITIRNSAAEYLTFVASTGDSQDSVEMRYEDENIWLTQRMMATLYDVSVPAINQHIKKVFDDCELEPMATIKKYLIVQTEGARQVSRGVDHYNLQMIIAVGFKVNNQRAVRFRVWANQIVQLHFAPTDVHEIKKHIPNMEMFLETAAAIAASCSNDDSLSVFRLDISRFKQVNDDYGFDVGDNVIVACFQMMEAGVNARLPHAAVGRAHGDEFIVFAKADQEAVRQTAESIVGEMSAFDFARIGCPKRMGCYIGGLVGHHRKIADIRKFIGDSIETLDAARQAGTNSIIIEIYRL